MHIGTKPRFITGKKLDVWPNSLDVWANSLYIGEILMIYQRSIRFQRGGGVYFGFIGCLLGPVGGLLGAYLGMLFENELCIY